MDEKIINELERMAIDKKELLSICMYPECAKIKIKLGNSEDYWFSKSENPELYERVLKNYQDRNSSENPVISHGLCPDCYKREMDKLK